MKPQFEFFELIDGRSTLFDILRKMPMKKADYVPILFNLISCGLVQVTDQASRSGNLRSMGIDEGTLSSVTKHLIRQETGILTYPAFFVFFRARVFALRVFQLPLLTGGL